MLQKPSMKNKNIHHQIRSQIPSLTFFFIDFFSQNGILTILLSDSHFCLSSYLPDSWLVNFLEMNLII